MKKIILVLLTILVLAGCSAQKADTTKELTTFVETLGKANLADVAISFDDDTTDKKRSLIDLELVEGSTVVADLVKALTDAKFESIDKKEIKETALALVVKEKTSKGILYLYTDGNARLVNGDKTVTFKTSTETFEALSQLVLSAAPQE